MMSTILWVIGLVVTGILALTAFGMTIGKKDREDFDDLAAYVDSCEKTHRNKELCWEEFFRLYNKGFIPGEDLEELRLRMIAKFR
jgi:tRNA A-37 threonylcarbamoyl transferase component Bud32